MAKEKKAKVDSRKRFMGGLAKVLLKGYNLKELLATKEGFVFRTFDEEGKDVDMVVRVIRKKALVENNEIVKTYKLAEEEEMEDEGKDVDEIPLNEVL